MIALDYIIRRKRHDSEKTSLAYLAWRWDVSESVVRLCRCVARRANTKSAARMYGEQAKQLIETRTKQLMRNYGYDLEWARKLAMHSLEELLVQHCPRV